MGGRNGSIVVDVLSFKNIYLVTGFILEIDFESLANSK